MDKKPKAGSVKKKAPPRKAKDEKQFERFIETARALGVDESRKEFEQTFSKIARSKKASVVRNNPKDNN